MFVIRLSNFLEQAFIVCQWEKPKKLLHSTEGLQKDKRLNNLSSPNSPFVSSGYRGKPLAGASDVLWSVE